MSEKQPSDPLRLTLDYYEENAEAFDQRTRDIDLSPLYAHFLPLLPPGALILDAGCGTGRDGMEFAKRGFRVMAFDASRAMVHLASARIGRPVLHLSFRQLNFDHEFDGIWASASLLHVPKVDMPEVLDVLHHALVPGGVLYASFKRGEGEGIRDGRFFNDYTEDELRRLMADWRHRARRPAWSVLEIWRTDDVGQNRPGVDWVNLLARAKRE
jgi:SAM-dependent methyltransferase